MPLFDPHFAERRKLKLALVIGGAIAGAVFGLLLTRIGKIVTGAPPATLANYAWNAAVLAVISGIVSPIVSWAALRRAPLWRTLVEPLTLAVAGGTVAIIAGVPALILVLPPVGLIAGFVSLNRRFAEPRIAYHDPKPLQRLPPNARG